MAKTNAAEQYRTNDMVLATLLHMEGHEYVHEKGIRALADGRRVEECQWVFAIDPEFKAEAEGMVKKFMDSEARVEPREFARTWADVRTDMFHFLNGDG